MSYELRILRKPILFPTNNDVGNMVGVPLSSGTKDTLQYRVYKDFNTAPGVGYNTSLPQFAWSEWKDVPVVEDKSKKE